MRQSIMIALIALPLAGAVSCAGNGGPDRTLSFAGHEVHYEVYGDSPKAVFFIHGWTGDTKVWKYQVEALSGYKVIALDLPGNGKSSKNEKAAYTLELFADTAAAAAKKESVGRAFFFGHSLGLAVVEVIAARHPDLCAGIGSLDGSHFELPGDPEGLKMWVEYNRQFAASMAGEKGREDFINMLFLPDTPPLLKDEILTASRRVPLSIGRAMIEGVETDQQYWARRRVDKPCLAVYSPAYRLTPEDRAAFEKTYPQCEYHEIDGVSHFSCSKYPTGPTSISRTSCPANLNNAPASRGPAGPRLAVLYQNHYPLCIPETLEER